MVCIALFQYFDIWIDQHNSPSVGELWFILLLFYTVKWIGHHFSPRSGESVLQSSYSYSEIWIDQRIYPSVGDLLFALINISTTLFAMHPHVLSLTARWDGSGEPPLHMDPPFKGLPQLEVTHPFHFKMTPGIFMGPKCNHDLGVLLRLPIAIAPPRKR